MSLLNRENELRKMMEVVVAAVDIDIHHYMVERGGTITSSPGVTMILKTTVGNNLGGNVESAAGIQPAMK